MLKTLRAGHRTALSIAVTLGLLFALGEAALVSACPMCKETVDQAGMDGTTGAATGGNPLGAGFAWSIYLMLAVPYLMIGVGAFVVWRGIRRVQAPRLASAPGDEGLSRRSSAAATESQA